MAKQAQSLHARLLKIIIIPLLIIAGLMTAAGYWEARQMTRQIYDKALLSIAHVISRDVVLNQGDLLAKRLLDTLTQALGDQVFYHIISDEAPTLLAGYTPRPQLPSQVPSTNTPDTLFFDSIFRDHPVRAVSFKEAFSSNTFRGNVRVTVWQYTGQRDRLSWRLSGRTLLMLTLLLLATAAAVWFGINRGLKPLLDLEDAVTQRSPDDLQPIRRAVPREVSRLVGAMNLLFEQLRQSISEKDAFIGNAAHQLRNPIAALRSQIEAAEHTEDEAKLRQRVTSAAETARRSSRLTQQLLSMERVNQSKYNTPGYSLFNLTEMLQNLLVDTATIAHKQDVEISMRGAEQAIMLNGNELLLREAFENILDNALKYGCANGGAIEVTVKAEPDQITVDVLDNGVGIDSSLRDQIFERFMRGNEDGSGGCGLGLSIARSIVEQHRGKLEMLDVSRGACFRAHLPVAKQ